MTEVLRDDIMSISNKSEVNKQLDLMLHHSQSPYEWHNVTDTYNKVLQALEEEREYDSKTIQELKCENKRLKSVSTKT